MRSSQELTILEVVRPVQATPHIERLVVSARTFASKIFESDEAVDLVTITDREFVGDDGPTLVGAQPDFCRIFTSDGLRLPLIERITVPEERAGSSFSAVARYLNEGRQRSKKELRLASDREMPVSEPPLKTLLNNIQTEAGHPDPNNLRVKVAKDIGYRFLGELQNGTVELVLMPDLADEVTAIVYKQAQMCFGQIEKRSRAVIYPASPQHLDIPFVRLSGAADPEQRGRFIEQVRTVLPRYVTLGEPRIRAQISS